MKRILLASVMLYPVAVWAQDIKPLDIKPGLWEDTIVSQMSGMSMPTMPQLTPEQLAKVPPQARAQIEAMQKGTPRTTTTKVCVTREQLSKPMFDYGEKGCSSKLTSASFGSQTIHMECTRGNTKSAGDIMLDRVDSEHLKGEMLMKASGDSSTAGSMGQNMTIKISFSNKFLSSDCGDVKPSGSDK